MEETGSILGGDGYRNGRFCFYDCQGVSLVGRMRPRFYKVQTSGLKVKTPVARGFVVRRSDRCIRRPRGITLDLLGNRR